MSGVRCDANVHLRCLLLVVCALSLVGPVEARAGRHVPGMSLTAEILAENEPPSPQTDGGADAAADTTVTRPAIPPVAPNTPGTITGYVRDDESGQGLPYTNIIIYRERANGSLVQDGGSIALTGGQYFARVAPGTYEVRFLYLGYENFIAQSVVVEPGTTLTLDVEMKVKPIEFAALTVQAQKITNTAVAQIAEKKRAVAVQEAITAEEISKSTDSDAAEALERVTGLSVVGGKFVFVRGLGDRYSSTTLNGAPLSSPEPGRETVPLDIFPAAMLDNIVVQKAYTPDMDGNFGGGNIDVRTRRGIEERTFNQKISYGYSQSVLDEDFLSYEGGATDLLALDDGTRALGRMLGEFENRFFSVGSGIPESESIAATFRADNQWTPRRVEGPPNFGYSGLYSDGFEVNGRRGSYLAALSYSHSAKTELFTQYNRRLVEDRVERASQETRGMESERSVLLGLTGAASFQPTATTNIQYNLLYTRSGEDVSRISVGQRDDDDNQFLANSLIYVERELLTHVVQGTTNFGRPGSELHWLISTSDAERIEPDNRFSRFAYRSAAQQRVDEFGNPYTVGAYASPDGSGTNVQRLWGDTSETSSTARLDWSIALPEKPWIKRSMRLGFSYRDRNRDEAYRRFGVNIPTGAYTQPGVSGRVEDLITLGAYDEFAATLADYRTEEQTAPYDAYDAERETIGMYAMLDIDFFETLRVSGGGRFETSTQQANSLSLGGEEGGLPPIRGRAETDDWLPAANATWRITDKVQTRLAYSRTLNRPQLRELSAIRTFNFELDEEEAGNPFVEPANVEAWDFRLEIFPAPRSYAAFSAFDKTIDKAILQTVRNKTNGRILFPSNGEDGGSLQGWEFEWRGPIVDLVTGPKQAAVSVPWAVTRPFWLLGKIPGLAFLGAWTPDHRWVEPFEAPEVANWGFTFNYSSITSEIPFSTANSTNEILFNLDPDGRPIEVDDPEIDTIRLTGQADSALNFGVFYGNGRQDFSLLFKDFGLLQQSAADETFHDPPLIVDTAFSTMIGENLKLKVSIEDIFPGDEIYEYERSPHLLPDGSTSLLFEIDQTTRRKYGVSLSYDF